MRGRLAAMRATDLPFVVDDGLIAQSLLLQVRDRCVVHVDASSALARSPLRRTAAFGDRGARAGIANSTVSS
jgi:hypothetical protein